MKAFTALLLATALAGCADDAPAPPGFTCDGPIVVTRHRIDSLDLPETLNDPEDLGLDLDGDTTVDNQAGQALAFMFNAFSDQDAAARYTQQLDQSLAGGLDWQLELSTCPSSGESRLTPINDVVPLGALAALTGGGPEDWHPTGLAVVEFTADDNGLGGRIAFALAPGYSDVYARGFLTLLNERLANLDRFDTPDIDDHLAGLDVDRDGELSVVELQASGIFRLLMSPDVDPDAESVADHDSDHFSLGLGFHATAVPTAP